MCKSVRNGPPLEPARPRRAKEWVLHGVSKKIALTHFLLTAFLRNRKTFLHVRLMERLCLMSIGKAGIPIRFNHLVTRLEPANNSSTSGMPLRYACKMSFFIVTKCWLFCLRRVGMSKLSVCTRTVGLHPLSFLDRMQERPRPILSCCLQMLAACSLCEQLSRPWPPSSDGLLPRRRRFRPRASPCGVPLHRERIYACVFELKFTWKRGCSKNRCAINEFASSADL
jgi:hypothetical protein